MFLEKHSTKADISNNLIVKQKDNITRKTNKELSDFFLLNNNTFSKQGRIRKHMLIRICRMLVSSNNDSIFDKPFIASNVIFISVSSLSSIPAIIADSIVVEYACIFWAPILTILPKPRMHNIRTCCEWSTSFESKLFISNSSRCMSPQQCWLIS